MGILVPQRLLYTMQLLEGRLQIAPLAALKWGWYVVGVVVEAVVVAAPGGHSLCTIRDYNLPFHEVHQCQGSLANSPALCNSRSSGSDHQCP